MTQPLTLPNGKPEHPAMDYAFLRSEGIRLLERLNGSSWTDFNAHDPGITILEQVCYAMTDLAYRINYDVRDILASGGETDPYRSLYSPAQVLTTNPVTLTDLRKLLLDVPGVKNAWLEPVETVESGMAYDPSDNCIYLKAASLQPSHRKPIPLRGLYKVLLEVDNTLTQGFTEELKRRLHAWVKETALQRLNACRTLAGDFLAPEILPGQAIVVKAEIEVGPIDNPEQLLAKVYYNLARSISPCIRFYTLSEMLARGKGMDEIMDGPVLMHGFIDDAELEGFQRKAGLRTSDLIREILNVEGTLSISSITVADKAWYLDLNQGLTPFLDIDASLSCQAIRLMQSGIQVQVDTRRVEKILEELNKRDIYEPLPDSQRDMSLSAGQDRNIGKYYSIQEQFPATYGIGTIGLPESASPERKAQARQLKAYLMFFDQLLANYFAQLENSKDLFSFYAQQPETYFLQVIKDEGLNIEEIYRQKLDADRLREIETTALGLDTSAAGKQVFAERKNRFLNHLLARFAEQFPEYSQRDEEALIGDKCAFLRDYKEIGAARGSGFDYTRPGWGTGNLSGLEKRISRKLGFSSFEKGDLSAIKESAGGGFHMLEHILLRPGPADKGQWSGSDWQTDAFVAAPLISDPYSNQVSFIFSESDLPESDKTKSNLIKKILREETPAHIRIHLHRLEEKKMQSFEAAYKTWLKSVIEGRGWESIQSKDEDDFKHAIHVRMRDARDRMVRILGLGIPYPLRDLRLEYEPMALYNLSTTIRIWGGQNDVCYQLCDEDGYPLDEKSENNTSKDHVSLKTPNIVKDITFTVLAIREFENWAPRNDKNQDIRLETYLNQSVSIKVGIDTGLPVAFVPAEGQVAMGNRITVNYGDTVSVAVEKTQEGISYKLVVEDRDLSEAQIGNQGTITLKSSHGLKEDTPIHVLAYRTDSPTVNARMRTGLAIHVRPDPAVRVDFTPPVVDHKAGATLTLISPQSSVEYHLFKRELTPEEYLGTAVGGFVVPNGEGRDIFIRIPGTVGNWETPDGFIPVEPFKESQGKLSAETGLLTEDTLFIIRATKIENRECLQLTRGVAILVRPDLSPVVGTVTDAVETGQSGIVTLENTQKGVFYQLRLDSDNTPVNTPGYHLTDRGVETVRVEVDLVVEGQGEPVLLLPTGAIEETTTFNILAVKIPTGVSAQLTGKAILDIQPREDG